jgi:hypothetical protein
MDASHVGYRKIGQHCVREALVGVSHVGYRKIGQHCVREALVDVSHVGYRKIEEEKRNYTASQLQSSIHSNLKYLKTSIL